MTEAEFCGDCGEELAERYDYERNYPLSLLEHHKSKIVVARHNYNCDCCKKRIKIGEHYVRCNVNYDGVYHFCRKCGGTR